MQALIAAAAAGLDAGALATGLAAALVAGDALDGAGALAAGALLGAALDGAALGVLDLLEHAVSMIATVPVAAMTW